MNSSTAYEGNGYTKDHLQLTDRNIRNDFVYLAERDGQVAGFYSLINAAKSPELDLMFVSDEYQAKGLGRELFIHMARLARSTGIPTVWIVSHPPSAGFYEAMGAIQHSIRKATDTVSWDRPILRLDLEP